MFNPSDKRRAAWRAIETPMWASAALLGLLVVPVVAMSGVATVESREAPKSAAYAKDSKLDAAYQMRCWQQGKLLFEERLDTLPPEGSRYALKVSGSDRYGKPVYVAETANATCLIRSAYRAYVPQR